METNQKLQEFAELVISGMLLEDLETFTPASYFETVINIMEADDDDFIVSSDPSDVLALMSELITKMEVN